MTGDTYGPHGTHVMRLGLSPANVQGLEVLSQHRYGDVGSIISMEYKRL